MNTRKGNKNNLGKIWGKFGGNLGEIWGKFC